MGLDRNGLGWIGLAWSGFVWLGLHGSDWGWLCLAWSGSVLIGLAGSALVWLSLAGSCWVLLGLAGYGWVWLGLAGSVLVWLGLAKCWWVWLSLWPGIGLTPLMTKDLGMKWQRTWIMAVDRGKSLLHDIMLRSPIYLGQQNMRKTSLNFLGRKSRWFGYMRFKWLERQVYNLYKMSWKSINAS